MTKNKVSAEDRVRKFSLFLSNSLNQPESNCLGNLNDVVYRGQPTTISTTSAKQEKDRRLKTDSSNGD